MRIGASAVVGFMLAAGACSSGQQAPLANDGLFGIHVGMKRGELARSFAPKSPGKWLELESVAGEARLRWAGDGAEPTPISVDVAIGIDRRVEELVFALRADDARQGLRALGAPPVTGLAQFRGPSGDLVVAPGLGAWTIRLKRADSKPGH
jgi:hypothetical protein